MLERLAKRHGIAAILNSRSPAFKTRGLDIDSIGIAEAIRLIDEEPNLLKRPLIVRGDDAISGWDPAAMEELIG